jgi:hypothetical protein
MILNKLLIFIWLYKILMFKNERADGNVLETEAVYIGEENR